MECLHRAMLVLERPKNFHQPAKLSILFSCFLDIVIKDKIYLSDYINLYFISLFTSGTESNNYKITLCG